MNAWRGRPLLLAERLSSCALRYEGTLARRTAPECRLWRGSAEPRAAAPRAPRLAAATPRDARLARLEAVLVLATEPIATRKLAQLSCLADGTEARTLVGRLNELYDQAGTAFRVEEIAGGFQLLTRSDYSPWLRRMHAAVGETRLSNPALETLAVVAYRQPVLRADIEAIRGVQCGEILRQLMERDLVRISGRSDELGRPFLYGTTKRFLQIFGLRHLDELPRAEQYRAWAAEVVTGGLVSRAASGNSALENLEPTEESAVTVALDQELSPQDRLHRGAVGVLADSAMGRQGLVAGPKKSDDEEDEDWEDEEGDEEDDEDWEDDDDEEDDEEDDDDDDFEDADWEEVEDEADDEEGDDEDEADDEDDDWDDDDEDDDDWEDDGDEGDE